MTDSCLRHRVRAVTSLATILLVWLGTAPVRAADPVFVWMDKSGVLHATDRLQAVPEPWFSMYTARLEELKKQGKSPEAVSSEPGPPTPTPSVTALPTEHIPTAEDVARQRQQWRAVVKHWREELAAATAALQKVEQDLEEASMNPILRLTPPAQEKIAGLRAQRALAQTRVEAAQRMLLEELPKRARAEHVPPLWLL